MPSSHHHRRRSPSPESSASSTTGHKHRSHKPKSSKRDDPPPYERPKMSNRRPDLNRSLSEDTYRDLTRRRERERSRSSSRERTRRDRPSRGDRGGDRDLIKRDRGHGDHSRRESRHGEDNYYDRRGRRHSISSSRSRSRSRDKSRDGLKTIVEDVLAAFGLVSAKHRGRDKGRSDSRSRSRGGHGDRNGEDDRNHPNVSAAVRAAITAAALEAFRTRKEFGGMTPERLLRIAGAAIAAGGLDAIVQRDKGQDLGSKRNLVESVIGGMKSSSSFGHRIRSSRGPTSKDEVKHRLMRAATNKMIDSHFGPNEKSSGSKDRRSKSSVGLSGLVRRMTVSDRK